MLKIGDFSRISQVPVKTLRYYDEIGLLHPERIEPFTGYRYYSAKQLPRLNRILALKDLGFSLEQIAQLLDANLALAEIQGMLRLKRMELQNRVEEEQARLARVEARLKQIEQEGRLPGYEVILKRVEAQFIASRREVVPTLEDLKEWFDTLFRELFTWLSRNGIRSTGPALALYHDHEFTEQDIDVEVGVVIAAPPARISSAGPFTCHDLPAESMACVLHRGDYAKISQAYGALGGWTEANSYRIVGPFREFYLVGPDAADPSAYLTEIQIPVEKPHG